MKTTRKKVKIIGTTEYIHKDTGTLEEMQVISMEDRDFNFHKIWLEHVIQSFDLIGNQKTKLAFWLISQMDSENKICYTLRQMAEKSSISLETVRVTVKALIDGEFLVKQNQGVYRVHPDRVFKGYGSSRMNVLLQYNTAKQEAAATTSPEQTLEDVTGQTSLLDAVQETTASVDPVPEPEEKLNLGTCHICGANLVQRTRSDDGKKFPGCPHWRRDDHKIKIKKAN